MTGQSTFLVELNETATIVRHASPRSLVILDELGRGTSTFDGTAIAYSVVQYLSKQIDCLCLFSTHYHMLMEEFAADDKISMYHMACSVAEASAANSNSNNGNETDVAFLYQFKPGVCPKSYGMNVARLAHLPQPLIQRAQEMSEQFERRLEAAHGKGREKEARSSTASSAVIEAQQLELRALLAALDECVVADSDKSSAATSVNSVSDEWGEEGAENAEEVDDEPVHVSPPE